MKLRNKKTGEIWDIGKVLTSEYPCWETLNQICEDWEDYKPIEPKITNPEWRDIVHKWYKLNGLDGKLRVRRADMNYVIIGWMEGDTNHGQEIDIPLSAMECNKDFYKPFYTITELCGEEEE